MFKKIAVIALSGAVFFGCQPAWCAGQGGQEAVSARLDPIKKQDRILILAPHPDDEALGCAGVIQQAVSAGAAVRVAYLTNGDHNQLAFIVYEKRLTFRRGEFIHMGEVRRREAIKAMELLGLSSSDLVFLGYPDFGTFTIFGKYWRSKKPFRSFLTRISSVPYKENLSFAAPYVGENILKDIKKVLLDFKPTKVFVSHPADVNVDHKSLYLFLEVALADLRDQIERPEVYPYLVHCVGWPLPRHYHPALDLEPPQKFLDAQINWQKLALTPQQLDKKYRSILCYRSQTQSSAFYLLSFARKNELFGDYLPLELERGSSRKQKVSFLGLSRMFDDADTEDYLLSDQGDRDKGKVSYALEGDALLIRMEKNKDLNRRLNTIFYLFGYSYKTSFSNMPKIYIFTKYDRFRVFDAKRKINPEGVSITIKASALTLKVPLALLGNPDFVLVAAKAHSGALPVDAIGFRKIEINSPQTNFGAK